MPVCLSFAGVAGCIAFQVGSAKKLVALVADEGKTVDAYAGLSSGSVVATLLALGYQPDEMAGQFARFATFFQQWYHQPVTHWFSHLRELWREIMPSDAYKSLSGRLYIGYTAVTVRGLQARVISNYTSNEEVMRAIEVSCHIMPYRWVPVQWYRGELCCDGAFSSRLLRPKGYQVLGLTTSMVHSHVFWSDWLPTLEMYKIHRLQASGEHFIAHHTSYFRAELRGEKPIPFTLPTYFNPFRWVRRLWYLCWLVVLWKMARKRVTFLLYR